MTTLTKDSMPAMDQPRTWLTLENALYAGLLALALALRLYQLGAHPLNDSEAREALIALRFVQAQPEAGAPLSPAYFFFTALGFLVFGPANFIARLAPALFGSALVLAPALYRDQLGRTPALVTAGLLAISSSLVAAARSADGAIIALTALVVGLGSLRRFTGGGRVAWLYAGALMLGVALAAGPSLLTGLVIVGLTLLAALWRVPAERDGLRAAIDLIRPLRFPFVLTLAGSAVVIATVGLLYRQGLGALPGSWLAWLTGLAPAAPAGRSALAVLVFLPAYEPLLLAFGAVGAVRAVRDSWRPGLWLTWLALAGLTFVTFYSSRSLFDVIWITAPLAALGGRAIADLVRDNWSAEERPLAAALAGGLIVLAAFAMLNVAAFAEHIRTDPNLIRQEVEFWNVRYQISATVLLWIAGASLVIGAAGVVAFGLGWTARAARLGLTGAALAGLAAFNLAAMWGQTQLRAGSPLELWWPRPADAALGRLALTLEHTSNLSVGSEHDIEVTVQAPPDGALAWALRRFHKATFVGRLDPLINTAVVIAPARENNPTLGSAYVGQDFAVSSIWRPENLSWQELLGWWTFRRAPVEMEHVILWVRQDVAQPPTAASP